MEGCFAVVAAYSSSSRRSDLGVQGIDVEGEVDRPLASNVVQRHLDNFADTVLVNVEHGEALDVCSKKGEGSARTTETMEGGRDALCSLRILRSPASMSRRPM